MSDKEGLGSRSNLALAKNASAKIPSLCVLPASVLCQRVNSRSL